MILFMDNFNVYDIIRPTGYMDLTWLSKTYTVVHSTNTLALRKVEGDIDREVLSQTYAYGRRSVYLPLGGFLAKSPNITISQKLIQYTPSGVPNFGLASVDTGTDDHILSFGFSSSKTGFIRYADATHVRQETFTLPTSLSLKQDTIEWSFVKDANDRSAYRTFTLWVNNKHVYSKDIFCQVGSSGSLCARVTGGVITASINTLSSDGFITGGGSNYMQSFGVTDLVVTNGQRLGRVRVLSRNPEFDTGPNSMLPSMAGDHYALVGTPPAVLKEYVEGLVAGTQEMYGAKAFEDLSSEAVLATAVRFLAAKNDPEGNDMVVSLQSNTLFKDSSVIPVDIVADFGQAVFDTNPWSGLPWTAGEVNNVRFGVKVS